VQLNLAHAQTQLKHMDTSVNKKMWGAFLAYINRTLRNAFQGIHLYEPGFAKVKELIASKQKVILVPIYRSFLDLTILLYTLYVNKIDFPFSFGNIDDVPTVAFMDTVLQNSGYISTTRSRSQSLQEQYINQATLREVLNKH
jgi:glycerol-3-phosphate O-acyltransferase